MAFPLMMCTLWRIQKLRRGCPLSERESCAGRGVAAKDGVDERRSGQRGIGHGQATAGSHGALDEEPTHDVVVAVLAGRGGELLVHSREVFVSTDVAQSVHAFG